MQGVRREAYLSSMVRYVVSILLFLMTSTTCHQLDETEEWTFVSMPDFLNVDCDYPQPGWENSLDYILNSVEDENPDFLMVPGDLVMGHWDAPTWNDRDTIAKYADRYYTAWKQRMGDHKLTCYTAIGDHEVGDNPWGTTKKLNAVREYKRAFAHHLGMPQNGPVGYEGTAFYWKHKNVLFVSVDVFEEGKSDQGLIKAGVTGVQLSWLDAVLSNHSDVGHKIVMGHAPILGPVRKWSSSGLMVEGGRQSPLWQTMKKHGVDLYLCGEVHAITCTERDGIMQIAHGGLIGYNTRTNYLVAKVSASRIYLELKEIDLLPTGEHLWQTKNNRPLSFVNISEDSRKHGFYRVGSLAMLKERQEKFIDRTGYFLTQHESSSETAAPIFRKDRQTELLKIRIED